MKIKSIWLPTALSKIRDIENDNIDVIVELEDGNKYTLVVATLKYLLSYMEVQGKDYIEAGPPFVIVKSLTADSINKAIKTYSQDKAYWLKLYHLSSDFNIDDLDKMMNGQS